MLRSRLTGTALAVTAMLAGVAQAGVPVVPVLTPAVVIDPLLRDAQTIARTTGLPVALVYQEVTVQDAVGELQAQIATQYPDTFGGLWIEQRTGLVHVAFTRDAAAAVASLRGGFTRPELLVPVTVAASYRDLKATQERMVADRAAGKTWPGLTGTRYAIDVDQRANQLVVVTDGHTAATVAAFRAAYGNVRAEATGNGAEHTCNVTDCRYSMRSGLAIGTSSTPNCTSAFTTYSGSTTYLLTAGHCFSGSVEGHSGLYSTGSGNLWQNSGNVDGGRVPVNTASYKAGPWIRVDAGEPTRKVTGMQLYSALAVGQWICKSGWTTGYTCGSVLSRDYSAPASWPSPAHTNFILTDMCDQPGDSGAGIYIGGQAVGIISSGHTTGCISGYRGWHGHVHNAVLALGVSVQTIDYTPVFASVSARQQLATSATITATFTRPVDCFSVNHLDFTVKVQGQVDYPVSSVSCTQDSNQTVTLTVTRPLIQATTVSVTLKPSAIRSPSGLYVSSTTRQTTVTP